MVSGHGVSRHHLCADTLYHRRLQFKAIGGLAAHVKAFQAPGIVSVCNTLLNCLPFKLGEHDTDIQHGPAHWGRGVELLRGGNKLHIVFLKQLHHICEVQNGAAYSVQLVNDYPANLALADLAKELLELGPVGILSRIALVLENPATASLQLILAEINLALNADTVLAVYRLSRINYIFSNIHVVLLSCGNGATNLQVYYTIDSPGQQCCGALVPFVPGHPVFAKYLIQTAFNLFFPFLLFLGGKYRRKTLQHNGFPLKRDGLGFALISNGLHHRSLLFKVG